MAKKINSLIILIERNSLTFSGDLFEKPIKMTFEEDIVSDLEIVDKKLFTGKILSQLKDIQLPIDFNLVFSDEVCFFKELPLNSTKEQIDQEEKLFISLMPFDKVAYKLIKFTNNYKFIGVNKNICTSISDALLSKGFKMSSVLPVAVIPNFNLTTPLPESLKTYSLMQNNNVDKTEQEKLNPNPKKSYLSLLIGVFVFFLIILVVLITQ